MKCEKCGKTYFTKECLNCNSSDLSYNKNNYNLNSDALKLSKTKHSNNMMKIGFIFFTIIVILIIGMMFLQIVEQREISENQSEIIKKLELKNIRLVNQNNQYTNQIQQLQRTNQKLAYNQRNNSVRANTNYNKPQTKQQPKRQTQRYTQPKSNTQSTTYNKPQNTRNTKIYTKYSDKIKLVSDSKITVKKDNRLDSSEPIVGRYYPDKYSFKNGVSNINCNLKQNIYKVVDDCSMKISNGYDEVFLSKMNVSGMQDFDKNKYMIECDYNKPNGVFHDCKIKYKS